MRTIKKTTLASVLSLLIPLSLEAQVSLDPGLDCWVTRPGDALIDLPALPAGFFGPGSKEVVAQGDFPLQGYPYDDVFGRPNPFPRNHVSSHRDLAGSTRKCRGA